MTDEEVHTAILDDPEVKPTDEDFWKAARVLPPLSDQSSTKERKRVKFRPKIHFDAQNDDAIIWGDEGNRHFRLVIRRGLLLREYGLKRYFDRARADIIMKEHRGTFEMLAQNAYQTGAFELIIG